MPTEKTFTLDEVKRLVTNAYEVGFLDGEGSAVENYGERPTDYINARDFWNKNYQRWISEPINYEV